MRFLILFAVIAAASAAGADEPTTRTLDTVAIEGEIDVPQVLFISSRDHLRFHDDTGDRYRPDALAIIRAAVLPLRLRAADAVPPLSMTEPDDEEAEPRSESPRTDKE